MHEIKSEWKYPEIEQSKNKLAKPHALTDVP